MFMRIDVVVHEDMRVYEEHQECVRMFENDKYKNVGVYKDRCVYEDICSYL